MTAQHVWLNRQDIILVPFLLYEYSHTAVCDMQIAAGELGPPNRYPGATPGQKLRHTGQGRLTVPRTPKNPTSNTLIPTPIHSTEALWSRTLPEEGV